MLAILALLVLPHVHTVDDDGPADFSDLNSAIQFALPGDTLIVAPGTYASATLDRSLTILSDPAGPLPYIRNRFVVDGVLDVSLCGLEFEGLTILNTAARVRIDRCKILGTDPTFDGRGLSVYGSLHVVVTRSLLRGYSKNAVQATPAVRISDSQVSLIDCTLLGPHGIPTPTVPGTGGIALLVSGSSQVRVVACDLRGGDGVSGPSGQAVAGGPAIMAYGPGPDIEVRGSKAHRMVGGFSAAGLQHEPLDLWTGVGIVWSGVTAIPYPAAHPEDPKPAPYFLVTGEDGLGDTKTIEAYGEAGGTMTLFLSSAWGYLTTSGLPGDIVLISVAGIIGTIPMTLTGQDAASTFTMQVPTQPGSVGLTLDLQGLASTSLGLFVTNSHQVILRH